MKILRILKIPTPGILLGIMALQTHAQFTLSAEVRPRTEFRNGFKTPSSKGFEPAFFTEQRSRIYFDYRQEKYQLKLAFQDVRFWGETTQIFKRETGTTFLSEAWGELYLSGKVSLKAGRQIISYDNERFIGGLEWAQQGRRHDALLLKVEDESKASKLHLGLAFNSDQDIAEPNLLQRDAANFYSVQGNYKTLQYVWYHKDFSGGSLSLLTLNNGTQNADSTLSNKQTVGLLASRKWGKLRFETENYYQTGKLARNHVNAFLASVNATLDTRLTPISLGYEFVSGKNSVDKSTEIRAFSPDFGTNHAHNGYMDYFFVGPSNGQVGVQDLYLKTRFKVIKGSLQANLHHFLTGSEQLTETGGSLRKSMGTELDLVYTRKIGSDITLNLGFSEMLATDTMKTLRKGGKTSNNWAWAMITFKPTLFSSRS